VPVAICDQTVMFSDRDGEKSLAMVSTRFSPALLVLPLGVALATSGCSSSKKHTASVSPIPSHSSAGSGTAGNGSSSGGTKTCPAGDVRATINGATKCLAAGQQCSAKAIDQYPQYHFVCRRQGAGYVLSRS